MWSDRTKIALRERIFRNKKFADTKFCCLYVKLATVQIEGKRTNSLLVFAL